MQSVINWQQKLATAAYNPKEGIRISPLLANHQFSTFLTTIDPDCSLSPRYHKMGNEHYHVLRGNAEVILHDAFSGCEQNFTVKAGESFEVAANNLSQLKNIGSELLVLIFSCPK
jgi:mannose-6-phosphate isomerase-like protein (cupin superfamily)